MSISEREFSPKVQITTWLFALHMIIFANSYVGPHSHVSRELSLGPLITGFTDRFMPLAVSGVPFSTAFSPARQLKAVLSNAQALV